MSEFFDWLLIVAVITLAFVSFETSHLSPKKEKCTEKLKQVHRPLRTITLPNTNIYLVSVKKGEAVPYDGYMFTKTKPEGY